MLIKRNTRMTSATGSVKKMTASALAGLAMCTTAIAPAAFSGDSPFVDTVIKVTFKMSDLQAEDGNAKGLCEIEKAG